MQTGTIGVSTENIFPVIKKFLYSDHEIFLRELVSNAVDATQKLRTLAAFGDFKGETGALDVRVTIDREAGTLTVSDSGIGMTAADVDRYINQIAFSGAEEFLNKFKDNAGSIIGHFGLGFYSAFMVSRKVVIETLSWEDGATPVRWECDGSPAYTMSQGTRTQRGTDIILHIDDDSREFLEQARVDTLLRKYCRFLPVPVISGKEQEWKDGRPVDTDRDLVINATEPKWMTKPSELTDKDYLDFYHELCPGEEDPLFWIHLNVDYPFTLTGILYFPRIHNNFDVNRNRIQLYCNQVFVTDSVEGVVPEFMMLMKGVIDSPDIPLNVSRSYLQADTAVRKISGYITRKVADRLDRLFKTDRPAFEHKWDDIRLFIIYGMLTDDKFCDAALRFLLLKDSEGRYYTPDEYRALVAPAQTDADGSVVYLYTTDPAAQYSFVDAARAQGYSVLVLDGQLDNHLVGLLERRLKDTRLVRVDSDVVSRLIRRDNTPVDRLSPVERAALTHLFQRAATKADKASFTVSFEELGPDARPITLTQNEYMRRMREMAALQPGMNIYGDLPAGYTIVVNTSSPLVDSIRSRVGADLEPQIQPLLADIDRLNADITHLRDSTKDAPEGDKATAEAHIAELEQTVADTRRRCDQAIDEYAPQAEKLTQLTDLALLDNGLLTGRHLADFIERSIKLL